MTWSYPNQLDWDIPFPHCNKFAFQRDVIAGNFRSLQVSQIKN